MFFKISQTIMLVFSILDSGANVILTTGGIDDLCLKYFVEAGAMAVRRCKKVDLKRYKIIYVFVQVIFNKIDAIIFQLTADCHWIYSYCSLN